MEAKKRKLKTFTGNLFGTRRGLVRATSKVKAAAVIGCSLYEFNNYWGEWDCRYAEEFEAGKLYSQPIDVMYGEDARTRWVEGYGR
jgi:hypothetical protein